MDTMILVGADDVRVGGSAVREAAREMSVAAGRIEYALQQHERFLTDWLIQFRDILLDSDKALSRGEK